MTSARWRRLISEQQRRQEGEVATGGLSEERLRRMESMLARHVESGGVPGLVWMVSRHGQPHSGVRGAFEPGTGPAVTEDTVFRISSMTKPVAAVVALVLLEECVIRLDDPVDDLLPELAGRRVLAPGATTVAATVPAARPITV